LSCKPDLAYKPQFIPDLKPRRINPARFRQIAFVTTFRNDSIGLRLIYLSRKSAAASCTQKVL
jgi:hypothetical protein